MDRTTRANRRRKVGGQRVLIYSAYDHGSSICATARATRLGAACDAAASRWECTVLRAVHQGSYKDDEGIGGASTIRGLPKNRYAGRSIGFANEELRWTAAEFALRARPSALVLSGFTDVGGVWNNEAGNDGVAPGLHYGAGIGARLRYGRDFVVALDDGHSNESSAPMYIGLGYLF